MAALLPDHPDTPAGLRRRFHSIFRGRPLEHPAMIPPPELDQPVAMEGLFPPGVQNLDLELGPGWGEVALERAGARPATGNILLELKRDRIRHILREADKRGLNNIRVLQVNLSWFLYSLFPRECFNNIHVYFPDPWPKRKHWKHRLITPDFAARIGGLLKPGGHLKISTDYSPYARRILSIFRAAPGFKPAWPHREFERSRTPVIGSFFEKTKLEEGYRPWHFDYVRQS